MSAFKESLDNHLPKVTKGLAWGAVKGATVGGLLFALNPLAGAIGAGIYYGKSMYNSYRKNPEDEIHFASSLRKYVLGTRANNNTNTTTGNLLGTLGGQSNTISNSPNNTPETQIDGEINDIEARINMWEKQTRPPNIPSQLIIAQITANLANQQHRLTGNTYRATGGNLWNKTIGNRIRNRRNQKSILERINDIKDTQTQVRIMGRVTSLQNTMNTIRGRLGTPPPTINVGGNTMTRIPHTIGTPVSIDLKTARIDIHGNSLLPLPAGATITNITITDTQTGAPLTPYTPFDPTTQSFELNPTITGNHNYTIAYTDSLGRTSPNLNFVIESQNNLVGTPGQQNTNSINTISNPKIQQPTITSITNGFKLQTTSNLPIHTQVRMMRSGGSAPSMEMGQCNTTTSGQIEIDFMNNRSNQSIKKRNIRFEYLDQNGKRVLTQSFSIDLP